MTPPSEDALDKLVQDFKDAIEQKKKERVERTKERAQETEKLAKVLLSKAEEENPPPQSGQGEVYDLVLPKWIPADTLTKAALEVGVKIGRRDLKGHVMADWGASGETGQISELQTKTAWIVRGTRQQLDAFKTFVVRELEEKGEKFSAPRRIRTKPPF